MALFTPILSAAGLPAAGPLTRSREAERIDFKSGYDPAARSEMAKDMAAFANALGGVVLIGTSRDDEPLAYPGMAPDFAERLLEGFADAQVRHLSPSPPVVERKIFDAPNARAAGFVLLAVNVHPFAEQIVGARVAPNVWRFPVRVGADTNFLEPSMLPLYTNAVRRNTLLLERIDWSRDTVELCIRHPRNQTSAEPSYVRASIHSLDVTKNTVVVTLQNESTTFHRIPLDDVDCVWERGTPGGVSAWVIRLLGHFDGNGGQRRYHSNPRNTIMRT